MARRRPDFGDNRRSYSDGAGLVEDQGIDVGGPLEKIGALDEDAKSCGHGHGGHHGGWTRDYQSRGRRDHEHGDGA